VGALWETVNLLSHSHTQALCNRSRELNLLASYRIVQEGADEADLFKFV
jgi:hypothetical protein